MIYYCIYIQVSRFHENRETNRGQIIRLLHLVYRQRHPMESFPSTTQIKLALRSISRRSARVFLRSGQAPSMTRPMGTSSNPLRFWDVQARYCIFWLDLASPIHWVLGLTFPCWLYQLRILICLAWSAVQSEQWFLKTVYESIRFNEATDL